jgi:hypothetical protein
MEPTSGLEPLLPIYELSSGPTAAGDKSVAAKDSSQFPPAFNGTPPLASNVTNKTGRWVCP